MGGGGGGGGGRAGQVSPLALIPWLCAELRVPVVAAGSIGTGAQALAALSLGAELCYMGTRFIATRECGAVEPYKELVTRATPEEIVYTYSVSGVYANFLRSTLPDEGPRSRVEPHKKWRDVWSAGHGVAQISSVLTISEVVQEVAWGYWGALERVEGFGGR